MAPCAPPPDRAPGARRLAPLLVALAVAVVILGGVGVALALTGSSDGDDVDRFPSPDEAAEAAGAPPDVSTDEGVPVEGFEYWDGTPGDLTDFAGTPVVVNFWSSTCVPCVKEMPAFETVHQELGDRVQFLGMNFQDRPEAAEALAERTGVTYDLARDSGPLLESLDGLFLPTTALVTADGRVVRVHTGELEADELRTMIDEELLR
jgi:thiol-disulfide isomerase/thioredoxin